MENTSDSLMPRPLLLCLKSEKIVCYSVPDNSQGTVIVNDAADFTGMNGCYLYQGRDVKPSKKNDLKDQTLVLAPHEGIVPSDIWLTCRKKLMNNMKIQSARKATHTWLAGKIKCGNCGYALMSINNPVGKQYLRCTKRLDNKSCAGCGKIITSELEAVVYQQMVKKLASYKTLTGRKKAAKANPKMQHCKWSLPMWTARLKSWWTA